MARLRVGIVGAGKIAPLHVKGYAQDDRAEIVAVCDSDVDRAISGALEWGAGAFFSDFDEMLQSADLDAIELLTPHYLHAEYAVKALSMGKHVSVERPIALRIEEAEQVLQVAASSDRVLQVYEPCFYYKPLLDARHLIDSGEIGQITHITGEATVGRSVSGVWDFNKVTNDSWRFNPSKGGPLPSVFDIAYPIFAMALYLVGPIGKVQVWGSSTTLPNGLDFDAPSQAMWSHIGQGDCYGSLSVKYCPDQKFTNEHAPVILTLRLHGTRGDLTLIRTAEAGILDPPLQVRRNLRSMSYGQRSGVFEESFVRATKNFIDACHGEDDPLLRGGEASQLLVLTTAYAESARRGRAITLQH